MISREFTKRVTHLLERRGEEIIWDKLQNTHKDKKININFETFTEDLMEDWQEEVNQDVPVEAGHYIELDQENEDKIYRDLLTSWEYWEQEVKYHNEYIGD